MEIAVYTFEDKDGNDQEWCTQKYSEAKEWAMRHNMKIILNTYVWDDSEMLEDFTDEEDEEDTEE